MFWTVFYACLLSQLVFALVGGTLMYALPKLVARFYKPVLDEVDGTVISRPLSGAELDALGIPRPAAMDEIDAEVLARRRRH